MIEILQSSSDLLREAGYSTERTALGQREALVFDGDTVLGFLFAYDSAADLMKNWPADSDAAISAYQFGLRKSGTKAWNTYLILLTSEPADYAKAVSLGAIEEDLGGTRKIARAGIQDVADLGAALLPLLALQSAPRLEAVDMRKEIRQRTTELPARVVDAFLSGAEESVVIQVLEESP
ncbi:hypothetical protein ABE587_07310 [[Pseudomonas] hibiscicola]|uniref:Uncharacterized protein n=1 Tax=Stenotrophomonas hibiscicola TaxID=86189 RepID=A0ABV0C9A1_9GAMM|nr:hypothetical protein [Stenotrophomonas sp. Sm10]MDQ7310443.1 hypothetical protein [Stenotrophomonas sp. Sm10]